MSREREAAQHRVVCAILALEQYISDVKVRVGVTGSTRSDYNSPGGEAMIRPTRHRKKLVLRCLHSTYLAPHVGPMCPGIRHAWDGAWWRTAAAGCTARGWTCSTR